VNRENELNIKPRIMCVTSVYSLVSSGVMLSLSAKTLSTRSKANSECSIAYER